jgi:hypothetical protein
VLTSTFLTLLVIPTVYEILTEWRDWVLARVAKSPRPATHDVRAAQGEAVPEHGFRASGSRL